ncbi:hypothetical protein LCGC14_0852470 [marine sediment metagenome]|uniref:Uncharacterized protein n=1 Tax=marine sediment metagenome TaxID=412755 RepID=A0A0F9PV26_9ZZZZ
MKGEIINIKCPNCPNVFLYKRRLENGDFKWVCVKCVYTYSSDWFDKFPQYEKFITRRIKNEF